MSALDTTRRALMVGAAALGSAELLPYARAAQAAPSTAFDHPDAELISLAAQLDATSARRDDIYRELDAAYDRHQMPEFPEALYWRRSDYMAVWVDRNGRLAQYGDGKDARWVYEDESEISTLRADLVAKKTAAIANHALGVSDRSIARIEEILGAHEAWTAACKVIEDREGITALHRSSLCLNGLIESIQQRLVATRAKTSEGLAAKARAAATTWVRSPDILVKELSDLLAQQRMDKESQKKLWAVSLLVDAIALGVTSRTASSEGGLS